MLFDEGNLCIEHLVASCVQCKQMAATLNGVQFSIWDHLGCLLGLCELDIFILSSVGDVSWQSDICQAHILREQDANLFNHHFELTIVKDHHSDRILE
jgi:hypothetical protein